jgi:hypothetical protein
MFGIVAIGYRLHPANMPDQLPQPEQHPRPNNDRLAEVGSILALGLVRLRARQSSELFRRDGESSLDFTARQSGHAETLTSGKA